MFETEVRIRIVSASAAAGLMIAEAIEAKIAALGDDAASLGDSGGELVEITLSRGLD